MALNSYLNKKVCLILVDGRCMVGNLISCDQVTNLALENCVERVIRSPEEEEASEEEPRGLFMVRGDNVVVCGLVDEELDGSIDWTKVRGSEIGTTKHV
ncbi:Sm-like ribonucleo [Lecanosticta acicola]|uniref:LSM2-LSM8 complex subunit LSM8 n=1 Tax=Lecanosticta acicola TaxID=111012 RepID=A0AAI8Z4P5_9PEZI|nr:Sm-like ribonucleo [Lecanosticta acicola]